MSIAETREEILNELRKNKAVCYRIDIDDEIKGDSLGKDKQISKNYDYPKMVFAWISGEGDKEYFRLRDKYDIAEGNAEQLEAIIKPMKITDLLAILGTTIKYDDANKAIAFFAMLNAYTEESQYNVSFRAPSSTGKSYVPIELSAYFPSEDIKKIAYASPTSFYHDGIWDEENKLIVMNLERKILIFLDQPHDILLQRLRPLLSHDEKELLVKITDKQEKRGTRTKNVIIKGFPSVLFCTGSLKIDEQEATRNFILSPEISKEKIKEGISLKALKQGNPKAYADMLKGHPERELLKKRILLIKNEGIQHVIIRNSEEVVTRFLQKYPKLKSRHQRDMGRLIALIDAHALLNLWHREREGNDIYANEEDINEAFELFDKVAISQELGIAPYLYDIFQQIIKPLYEKKCTGLERKEIAAAYYERYNRALPDWYMKQEILPALEAAGLIYQDENPTDKRKTLVFATTPPLNSTYLDSAENYVESDSGVGKGAGKLLPKAPEVNINALLEKQKKEQNEGIGD